MVSVILATLLSMFRAPAPLQRCMEQRATQIVAQVEEAERMFGVPPSVLLVVAYQETHIGCDRGEGGNWGAPISRRNRHTPGTSFHAARALARSFEVCGNWRDAVMRFRTGLCRFPEQRVRGYTPAVTLRIITRLHQRSKTLMPQHWHPRSRDVPQARRR